LSFVLAKDEASILLFMMESVCLNALVLLLDKASPCPMLSGTKNHLNVNWVG
jgi:hypothetical protein